MNRLRIQQVWEVLWRAAIVILPWQTRWFSDRQLAGWAWEQGRISVYGSWFVLAAAIVCGFALSVCERLSAGVTSSAKRFRFRQLSHTTQLIIVFIGWIFCTSILAAHFSTNALRPVLQWWSQIFLLVGFVWLVHRRAVPWVSVAGWFVIAVIPHAVLGVTQVSMQRVVGWSWLGMATQTPARLGVSIIEHGGLRWLRAYGGFPHPNIFGGWLAIAVLVACMLVVAARTKKQAVWWTVCTALCSVALLLTYSRGAWIAAVVGVSIYVVVRYAMRKDRSLFLRVALGCVIVTTCVVGYTQRGLIFTRTTTSTRLEVRSVNERVVSLQNGWKMFREHTLFGTGPNVELLRLAEREPVRRSIAPLEPPHNFFLLMLADIGVVGVVLVAYLAYLCVRSLRRQSITPERVSIIVTLFVLALFDHYLWSLWVGQSLLALGVLLCMTFSTRD